MADLAPNNQKSMSNLSSCTRILHECEQRAESLSKEKIKHESHASRGSCIKQKSSSVMNSASSYFEFYERNQTTATTRDRYKQLADRSCKTGMKNHHNMASHKPASPRNEVKIENLSHCDMFRDKKSESDPTSYNFNASSSRLSGDCAGYNTKNCSFKDTMRSCYYERHQRDYNDYNERFVSHDMTYIPHELTVYPEHRPFQRRGSLQLWQFLVILLEEPDCSQYISWTGRGMEFKLIDPEEVARRWGIQKNRPAMNYDKLSRSLRYYYEKGILQKVAGERYVYKFVCNPEALFGMAFPDCQRPYIKPECRSAKPLLSPAQPVIALPHDFHNKECYQHSLYLNNPGCFQTSWESYQASEGQTIVY